MKQHTLIVSALIIVLILFVIFRKINKCQNRVIDAVRRYAPDAQMILDLGCGSCCNGIELEKEGKTVISLDVVNLGVCKIPKLFNGSDIPYPDKTFDLGICSFVLHHTETQIRLLQELKRTCKIVIIIENTPETPEERYYTDIHARSHWGGCSKCFKSVSEWMAIFKDLDIKINAVEHLDKWDCPFSDCPWYYPVTSTVFVLSS